MPAANARCVTSNNRRVTSSISPTGTVSAASVYIPSSFTPTSTVTMSPLFRMRFREGMPCTISSLIEMHTLPGKPYSPLNAGSAPACERMNASPIASRSIVLIPGRTASRMASNVARRIAPPRAIISISRVDLSIIADADVPVNAMSVRQVVQTQRLQHAGFDIGE